MKDKLNNVPITFPKSSSKMSEYCKTLIKACTEFKTSNRPTFDKIIEDMSNNRFQLAQDRCHELNRIRIRNNSLNMK